MIALSCRSHDNWRRGTGSAVAASLGAGFARFWKFHRRSGGAGGTSGHTGTSAIRSAVSARRQCSWLPAWTLENDHIKSSPACATDGIVAPFLIDGAMNGPIFLAYIEQCLAPTLGRRDIVIMDNLPAHKVAGVIEAIEALGASVLYLPSISPDLNPIEQFFSKLKALLRQAAERTIPNLCRRIRLLLRTVCPEECTNFLRHAGYVST